MNKLGLHALVWVGGWNHEECETAITKTAEIGYDYIEIPALDHAAAYNLFNLGRHLVSAKNYQSLRARHLRLTGHVVRECGSAAGSEYE